MLNYIRGGDFMNDDLTEIKTFAKKCLDGDITGHDYFHVNRVAQLATRLYVADHAIPNKHAIFIIQIAAYLHDTIDEKVTDNISQRLTQIHNLKTIQALSSHDCENVFDTIQNMSFSKNIKHQHHLSVEGQYVQDADRIEALGAIGIARTFAYGGKHDNPIYDPRIPVMELTSHDQYRTKRETTINHFYEKLFTLEDLMNTSSGKKLAHQRTKFMRNFVNEFLAEWNLKD